MKNPDKRHNYGFTLIELLVVMAIIVTLAAVGFAAGTAAMNRARKTQALNTCSGIEGGIARFYDEYSQLPDVGASDEKTPIKTTETAGVKLLTILLAQETSSSTVQNTKGIKFIELKETKSKKGGIVYSGSTPGNLYDPWGYEYNVVFDLNFDDQIPDPLSTSSTDVVRGRRALCYSLGQSHSRTRTSDLVKTW